MTLFLGRKIWLVTEGHDGHGKVHAKGNSCSPFPWKENFPYQSNAKSGSINLWLNWNHLLHLVQTGCPFLSLTRAKQHPIQKINLLLRFLHCIWKRKKKLYNVLKRLVGKTIKFQFLLENEPLHTFFFLFQIQLHLRHTFENWTINFIPRIQMQKGDLTKCRFHRH